MKRKFTLRKAVVKKKLNQRIYSLEDLNTLKGITLSLTGRQIVENLTLNEGSIVYVVVSPSETSKGRLFTSLDLKTEYGNDLVRDKKLLDDNIDPML